MLILSSFAKKLPERLMFERTYNNDEEDKYSRSKFYYPENLETSNVEKLKQTSKNVPELSIDDLINKQKVQT